MPSREAPSLYQALGVEVTASQEEIKRAYRRLAIQLHPDKNRDNEEEAKDRFQQLQRVYAVLSDKDKREVYDRTGSLQDSEELSGSAFSELYELHRGHVVSEEDILAFERSYRGSSEERADLVAYYARFGGDMRRVMQWVMCSRERADAHRFSDILEAAIAAGEVRRTSAFSKWAARVARTPRPPPEEDDGAAGVSGGGSDAATALVAAIRGKAARRNAGFLASLEAKYGGAQAGGGGRKGGGKGRGGSGKRSPPGGAHGAAADAEPTEEEFVAAQQRLVKKGRKGQR